MRKRATLTPWLKNGQAPVSIRGISNTIPAGFVPDDGGQSGYDVRIENQNAFQFRGHSAILAGKPDLLVLNKDRILIIDFKTGQEQP